MLSLKPEILVDVIVPPSYSVPSSPIILIIQLRSKGLYIPIDKIIDLATNKNVQYLEVPKSLYEIDKISPTVNSGIELT